MSSKTDSDRVLHGKYFYDSDPWKAFVNGNDSFLWKSLVEGRKVVVAGNIWRVGDEMHIDAWNYIWIPELNGKTIGEVLEINHVPNLMVISLTVFLGAGKSMKFMVFLGTSLAK